MQKPKRRFLSLAVYESGALVCLYTRAKVAMERTGTKRTSFYKLAGIMEQQNFQDTFFEVHIYSLLEKSKSARNTQKYTSPHAKTEDARASSVQAVEKRASSESEDVRFCDIGSKNSENCKQV